MRVVVLGGGGQMGSGIAQVVATAGFDVAIVEADEKTARRGVERIERGLEKLGDDGSARARIDATTELEEAVATADHVIETVVEDLALKQDVWRRADAVAPEATILASNTSQFSVSRLAAATTRPDRVVGSHWFNPPVRMQLIEIVRGLETSDETLAATVALAHRYGKQTVVCRRDTPGFVTSRLIALFMVEAARIVEEGIASPEDVDLACKLGFGHALGPLATADLSGLDVLERVADNLREHYGDRFLVPQGIRALVAAGHLGRKTGRGIHEYEER